jgi:hypothetical protein
VAAVGAAAVEEDDPVDATTGGATSTGLAALVPSTVPWVAGTDVTGAGAEHGAAAVTVDAEPPWASKTDET